MAAATRLFILILCVLAVAANAQTNSPVNAQPTASSESSANKSEALDPSDATAWRNAVGLWARGHYTDARIAFESYARVRLDSGPAQFWIGCCCEKLGLPADAEQAFRRCISLETTYAPAYERLAALVEVRDPAGAVKLTDEAIALGGVTENRLAWLYSSLLRSGNRQRATNVLVQYISLYPGHPESYAEMGTALYVLHLNYRAETHLKQALALKPDDYYSQFLLADVYYSERAFDSAAEAYQKAILIHPERPRAHVWRGWSLYQIQDYDKALSEFEKASDLEPGISATARLYSAYLAAGRYRAAYAAHPVGWALYVTGLLGFSVIGFVGLGALCVRLSTPGIWISLGWVGWFFASRSAATFLAGLLPGIRPAESEIIGLVLAHAPLLILALAFFPARPWGRPFAAHWALSWRLWKRIVAGYLLSLVLIAAYKLIAPPASSRSVQRIFEIIQHFPAATFACIVLIDPMAEEIICRGLLYGALRKRWGLWAIPVTSAVFAAYHFDPPQFIPIFVMGLLLAWVRELTGSIWPSYFLHAANNAVSFLWIYAVAT